jgi:hypothetical protein
MSGIRVWQEDLIRSVDPDLTDPAARALIGPDAVGGTDHRGSRGEDRPAGRDSRFLAAAATT